MYGSERDVWGKWSKRSSSLVFCNRMSPKWRTTGWRTAHDFIQSDSWCWWSIGQAIFPFHQVLVLHTHPLAEQDLDTAWWRWWLISLMLFYFLPNSSVIILIFLYVLMMWSYKLGWPPFVLNHDVFSFLSCWSRLKRLRTLKIRKSILLEVVINSE